LVGFDAKRYALAVSIVLLLGLLAWCGYVVIRRRWRLPAIAVLGIGLWLFVMLAVMPLTSAGFFALDLLDGKHAAIGGYLAVSLSFAALLALFRSPDQAPPTTTSVGLSRRGTLSLIGASVVAYVGTFLAASLLPKQFNVSTVVLTDPQEPVPSGGLEPPNPHPNLVATPAAAARGSNSNPAEAVEPAAPPTGGLPQPSGARTLVRDKDGAVVPSGRAPGQLASSITSNEDFYVVTKNAGGDPIIKPEDWRLLVDGEVEHPFQIDYATLRRLPSVEVTKTLECISNFVGNPELAPFGAELIGNARWRGVPVRDILNLVGGPKDGATWVAVVGTDEYTTALPLQIVMDPNTLLVYEMNGDVLPREHGYPARMLVPDRYGMKNAKWVVGIRPMRREFTDWYAQRNWTREGIVRTMSRLDTPPRGAVVQANRITVAGIAYAGTRGIARVEVSADDGETWEVPQLLEQPEAGADQWVRWSIQVSVPAIDTTTLVARATDGTGELQTEVFALPEPNGGTGWPHLEMKLAQG
jgi:DMSO/TMAO reductase YedYZ molybdopterin-dependent catalytic subunit